MNMNYAPGISACANCGRPRLICDCPEPEEQEAVYDWDR